MFWILIICYIICSTTGDPHLKNKRNQLVGGRDPKFNEVKYIVVVRSNRSLCGGGIISENHILTAAHCIKVNQTTGKLAQPMKIFAGTNAAINYNIGKMLKINVAKAYLPAVYKKDGRNDIAILELKRRLNIMKYHEMLQMLRLPEPLADDASKYPTYENATVKFAGYGNTQANIVKLENGQMKLRHYGGGRLQVANAIINDEDTCSDFFPELRTDQMCLSVIQDKSKKKPQGTCAGDSGSPAVYNKSVLIGLDSRGVWCNNNLTPSLFTRVSSYIPFIKNVMAGKTDGLVVYKA